MSTVRNPKTEIRRPKEGQRPKSEEAFTQVDRNSKSATWTWGVDSSSATLMLHEHIPSGRTPAPALQERTAQFGQRIIEFAKKIPQNPVNSRLVTQLVGAGTRVGANYCEADDSVSGKEFKLKIGTSRKESKETMFFLRMVAKAEPNLAEEARALWREAKELNLIFGAIWRK